MPKRSRATSASPRRLTICTPSGSSTTPNPKGTSPRYPGGRLRTVVNRRSVPRSLSARAAQSAAEQYGQVPVRGK